MTQDAQPKEEVTFDTFAQLDIRTGTIVEASPLKGARVPAYRLKVDFGPAIGIGANHGSLYAGRSDR